MIKTVHAYHAAHPAAAKSAWYPDAFDAISGAEWQQLYVNAEHDGTVAYPRASDGRLVLRDLTTTGRLPTIAQFDWETGGIVYPLGGTLVRFLAERYGEWRIVQVYDDLWKYADFETLVQGVFGRTLEQLTAEWHLAMRRRYYGSVARQEPLEVSATRVAALAIKPAVWTPPGDTVPQVLYLSPRTGYTNVYAAPLAGGRSRTVVAGERTAQFESFHAFESRLDVSPRGFVAGLERSHCDQIIETE